MEVLTPAMMTKCDQETIEAGYPEILLMESAALGTAKLADEVIKKEMIYKKRDKIEITILVGKGNNGGDGLAAARILKNWGYKPKIILSSSRDELKGVNKKNLELAVLNKIKIYQFPDLKKEKFLTEINNSDLIIDALLGTGITGELRGNIKKIINLISQEAYDHVLTLAVDIPSGIIGKTGNTAGEALKADYTATMAAYKRGLILYPGRDYSGEVQVIDIGIQKEAIEKYGDGLKIFNQQEAKKLIPYRKNYGHKGDFGKIAVLAGSRGMTGAPLLTTKSALKSGSGLVYLLISEEIEALTSSQLEELVGIPLPSQKGIIAEKAFEKIKQFSKKVDLLAVGPGLGSNTAVQKIIKNILEQLNIPLVLDADALNVINDLKLLKNYQGELILTPHPGEMSRLIGLNISEINNNRLEIARDFAKENNLSLVLKGAATITAASDGRTYINSSGCNGMATAGSGDVLTGIVSSLKAQGMNSFEAAALAVYVHGRAGEYAAAVESNYALTAGNIIDNLAAVWNELT
ncbi:bifunctional ADP-dependent NAD(P)H-hydrate dehydratase/NAD(P)H-hydrate epimerase [Halanaerobium congolense]|uniref:bifunctional ADP-dependent NAD(P)H-hydrate dehydratase/NAD(P)H-hydrate epimerase n=1 Tax=Halanaerobium congolense TaxID=54121 RepID=UPI00091A971F|nr:bifunctional ADP-dependent NAD(P)H-hydrate dehydratase/NAD(P)H-hydrate epimerase [Halanaerobium congolense]SHM43834.1 NAD(P)H-hydrate epimerase [Halanaerobium congolense]